MVKLTKIYTRTGDQGETHLADGSREKKTHLIFECVGDIDELNSWFGHIVVAAKTESAFQEFIEHCLEIQQQLFNIGAEITIPKHARRENSPEITQTNIDTLEKHIDEMNILLDPLTSFILPGGGELASRIHIARSVCRRAERNLFRLYVDDKPLLIQYINRLSDWLFVAARYSCHIENIPETLWHS